MTIIKQIHETAVTKEALYALANKAFSMWSDHHLEEKWMYRTIEEFKKAIESAMIFVALDADSEELLGMHCFRVNMKKKRAYSFYLAVLPKVHRQGIATKMIAYESEVLRRIGITHIKSSTTTDADWSVHWHLKNGYKLTGFKKSDTYGHKSFIFRKQLEPVMLNTWSGVLAAIRHPIYSLYSFAFFCHCRFLYDYKRQLCGSYSLLE